MAPIWLNTLQRQQYPQLPEEVVQAKGQDWKSWDEKELERRRASCQDILQHQHEVSSVILTSELSARTAALTFLSCSHPPRVAHLPHPDHTEQPQDSGEAGVRQHSEPAGADLKEILGLFGVSFFEVNAWFCSSHFQTWNMH